jgi:nucleoid-associated protein YgaU
MFNSRSRTSERGQMVVIVALGLTALVAMAGLVIDGGMAWANRRQVQNAADSASLAGTRILGLDLKWRAVNAANPSPPPAPFANPDAAVCDAVNNALAYNTNNAQSIAAIDCVDGSPDAMYVDFDKNELGQVGDGIPANAQGVKVVGHGASDTFLMGVIGISTIDVAADAIALAGPAAPPLGNLMPFVVQNPLGPFVPGEQYEVRSESAGECGASLELASAADDAGIVLAMAPIPDDAPPAGHAAPGQPTVPVATPDSTTFTTPISVSLAAENGAKIYYTTDGTDPQTSGSRIQYNSTLTFRSTTVLKAIAEHGGKQSDVGTFTYTQGTPPEAVTATPDDGSPFTTSITVNLSTTTIGSTIYYTTDGSNPTTTSAIYSSALNFSATTQVRAMAWKDGIASAITTFNYVKDGDTQPPVADPPGGTSFETSLNVTLTSPTPGATVYYTVDGSDPTTSSSVVPHPLSLVSTTTVRAMASVGGVDSLIVDFTYTKTGVVCPDLSAGNFGWVDFSGGSNSNADLKDDITNPEDADIDWYYDECVGAGDTNCRDVHDAADAADDHWLLEGTSGHRDISMRLACDLYLGDVIYIPIWDGFETITKKPNGNNAVFHLIGFAAFRMDGTIDNKNDGDPSNDACGAGVNFGGTPNDKGFVGTYVDSFVGTQVAPCIPSPDGTNPCSNLSNDAFTINLAD